MVITSTAVSDTALNELARFLNIAADRAADGEVTPMFSAYLDRRWHAMLNRDDYQDWCEAQVGRLISHKESVGRGPIAWIPEYERRFGSLPEMWFATADGRGLDHDLLARYRSTGTVTASWSCHALDDDNGEDD